METPVNLTNLRTMTDGDKELEKALFEEFQSSFEAGIAKLRANTGEEGSEVWRQEAHALKGIALNLGADTLGDVCKKAQEEHLENGTFKEALLNRIEESYLRVKEQLDNEL